MPNFVRVRGERACARLREKKWRAIKRAKMGLIGIGMLHPNPDSKTGCLYLIV